MSTWFNVHFIHAHFQWNSFMTIYLVVKHLHPHHISILTKTYQSYCIRSTFTHFLVKTATFVICFRGKEKSHLIYFYLSAINSSKMRIWTQILFTINYVALICISIFVWLVRIYHEHLSYMSKLLILHSEDKHSSFL